jgi:hypothetical protein
MKKLATALVAAGALFALSGCIADPYYGNSYYGGGYSGSPYGGSGYGYYGYGRPNNYGRSYGYGGYNQPYRGRYDDRRYNDRRNYRRY